jgi:hypothetical protein
VISDRASLDAALARILARALVEEIRTEQQQNEPPKTAAAPPRQRNGAAIVRGVGGRDDHAQHKRESQRQAT